MDLAGIAVEEQAGLLVVGGRRAEVGGATVASPALGREIQVERFSDSERGWNRDAGGDGIRRQIREISNQDPAPYLPFIGTLFLMIALMNLLNIVPGYEAPTGSLSTTAALALCVFFAVPVYGIARQSLAGYLKQYVRPTPLITLARTAGETVRAPAPFTPPPNAPPPSPAPGN